MRFAAAPVQQPEQRSVATDLRRLAGAQDAGDSTSDPQPRQDLPADLPAELDQRVRLVGEW
jgi:hypothetical protein